MENEVRNALVHRPFQGITFNGEMTSLRFENASLHIFGHWRVRTGNQVITGSDDSEEKVTTLLLPMHHKPCKMIEIDQASMDLLIHLEDDSRIEIMQFSSKYECWNLITSDGGMIIGGPGDLWSVF